MNLMRERWLRLALPVLTVGALSAACGDDEPTGVTIADLAGTWNATSVALSSPLLGPAPVDLVLAGATVTLVINNDGSFSFNATNLPLVPPTLTVLGTIEITGDNTAEITVEPVEPGDTPTPATFTLSGDNLTISVPDAELLDLTGDGVEDPTDLTGAFTRVS